HGQRRAADVHRRPDRRRLFGLRIFVAGRPPAHCRVARTVIDDGLQCHGMSSSSCSALLMAHAAFTPSAAATTTNCASRDASPATNTRSTLVSQVLPVLTAPRLVTVHPREIASGDCGCGPVEKNSASQSAG